MKLARFHQGDAPRIGLVDEATGRVFDTDPAFDDMVALIQGGASALAGIMPKGEGFPLDAVTLEAPIPRPARNVFCVGKNYHEHAHEFAKSGFEAGAVAGAEIDTHPAVFTKPASCVVGPYADVDLHAGVTDSVDYEVELTLVIGKKGRDIRRENALEHVWGYTIVNDVTARDRQRRHKQWFLGKALDTFCPMGPWIATSDEVDPENLTIRSWVNDEPRQNANTKDLIFDIPSLIETLSAGMTLVPGDLIATGTPAGVGIGMKPPRFLKKGDVVRMSITGLGSLSNRFV
ncbi:MAG: fumarylacetoacetate hydrolase family protein [Geminicoccaceae bacterium]|nr:fumarylacetoacetate hydrolase family protein [Geminicoccaceae bacterium]